MPSPRDFFFGPWRAVGVLGITQILSWGAIFYPPVMMVPLISAERGYSFTFAMGGFSAGLLVAGLVSPTVGGMIDRYGGHRVMPFGSLAGALGLVGLVYASHPLAYVATWMLLGAAMAASLYDAAFATLGRIFGVGARQPITVLTLAGGFASTVSWPATYAFIPSGLSAHLLAIFQRAGIEPGTVVIIGALFGPSQVAARLCEFIFARNVHPLLIARFAVGLLLVSFGLLWLFGLSTPVA